MGADGFAPPPAPGQRCPCGAGAYDECCGPVHGGEPATTALALMRSRYSAYVLGLRSHLLATWHPSTRPGDLRLDPAVRWRGLQIVDTAGGGAQDQEGVVQFRAVRRGADGIDVQHERSRFSRDRGRWVYVDGERLP